MSSLYKTFKTRNTFFDAWFYDVTKLSSAEKDEILLDGSNEGKIIVVPPNNSPEKIKYYRETDDFLASEGHSIKALVIAGVGSSTLGTAALARNVANVYQINVAGIVSGYGATDLISEALGGWFFYGTLDRFQQQIRNTVENIEELIENSISLNEVKIQRSKFIDINALNKILDTGPSNLRLLLGHSKGDLLIDYALERFTRLNKSNGHQYFNNLNIITIGTVTDIPKKFQKIYQFLGQVDWFGGMNSRFKVEYKMVPNAWHHLNTQLPFHLDLEETLRENVFID